MIRVLHVVDYLKQRYGVTSFLLNFLRNIDSNKLAFDFLIIDSEKEILDELKQYNCQIYYMPKLGLNNAKSVRLAIDNCLKNTQYDIVHSHFYQIDFILFKECKKYGVCHRIAHSHCTSFGDGVIKQVRNKLLSLVGRHGATDYCACSAEAGKLLFGSKSTVKIINNAIDISEFVFDCNDRNRIRNEYGINNNTLLFGHVGSFKESKNQKRIVEIFKEIHNIDEDTALLLVGDGELKHNVEEQVVKQGLSTSVIFAGVSNDVSSFCSAFDCMIFPSLYEGLGIVLIEAQASNLPFVASDVIPYEARLDKDGEYRSLLKDSNREWAETAIRLAKLRFGNREYNNDFISENGFDINEEAIKLHNYYQELLRT